MSLKSNLKSAGEGLKTAGLVCCFIMGVVGILSVDAVLLYIMLNEVEKSNKNADDNGQSSFWTGYFIGSMMNNRSYGHHDYHHHHHHHHCEDSSEALLGFFVLSLLSTVLACVLAGVFLGPAGLPIIIGLVGGWAAAGTVTVLGVAISAYADSLPEEAPGNGAGWFVSGNDRTDFSSTEIFDQRNSLPLAEAYVTSMSSDSSVYKSPDYQYVIPTAPPLPLTH